MNKKAKAKDLEQLIRTSIDGLPDGKALTLIGLLIDASGDAKSAAGTDRAFALLDEIQGRTVTPSIAALIHYFRANAWGNRLLTRLAQNDWAWEQPERQSQILELRRAMRHEGFDRLTTLRQCQILTNLANQLNSIGRFIEAIEIWDRVLQMKAHFAMALGNRGIGLSHYAQSLYDPGQAGIMQVAAHDALTAAIADSALYEGPDYWQAQTAFETLRAEIRARVDVETIRRRVDLHCHSLGKSAREKAYRTWCLERRLFINPLNDLGPLPIAGQDVLTLPSLAEFTSSARVLSFIGFFNQMKQEFVSARFLLYDGLHAEGVHFSDQRVLLYNTLDYPAFGLAVEKLRVAFRIAYSLFDKISYFLNAYFEVGRSPRQVTFRSVWYEAKGASPRPLLQRFTSCPNWPLRGLFWLSKDLFEEEFQLVTDSDAQALNDIRNHLEHKYLQIHQDIDATALMDGIAGDESGRLSYAITQNDFSAKTLRLLKLVRVALMYLSLAVYREECLREDAEKGRLIVPIPLDPWKDR